jgi:hypothetical protein
MTHFAPRRTLGRTGFAAARLGIGDPADRGRRPGPVYRGQSQPKAPAVSRA